MIVCFFGIYDTNYPRTRVIAKGLEKNGVKVILCRIDSSLSGSFRLRDLPLLFYYYLKLLFRYINALRRSSFDIILLGYPGWHVMPIAKLISLVTRRPLVFDAHYSIYDTDVVDRRFVKANSLYARLLFLIDKISCNLADIVLLDTYVHIAYFSRAFDIRKEKFRRILVGSDDDVFYPRSHAKRAEDFLVAFWGKYIPLQGVEYIVKAAKLLEDEDIRFRLLGVGQQFPKVEDLCNRLKIRNIDFLPYLVPYERLPDFVAEADLCLGIFGDTPKARRVIPNKVYESLAMGKPAITGDSVAMREVLVHGETCYLCRMGDAESLANSIRFLKENYDIRKRIADKGYQCFRERFTPKSICKELTISLSQLIQSS